MCDVQLMEFHFIASWSVTRLRMEEAHSRYGRKLRLWCISSRWEPKKLLLQLGVWVGDQYLVVTERMLRHFTQSIRLILWSIVKSRDSTVGNMTGYGLDGRAIGVRFPVGARSFSSPRRPDRSGAYPTPYPMGTGVSLPGGKAAGAWSWAVISN
jgi:hypothetical protein